MLNLREDVEEMFAALEGVFDFDESLEGFPSGFHLHEFLSLNRATIQDTDKAGRLEQLKAYEATPERKAKKAAHQKRRDSNPEAKAAKRAKDRARYLAKKGEAA